MSTTVQSIVDAAQIILVDAAATRWPEAELTGWVNAAVRAVAEARPDATTVNTELALAAGTKQTLPAGATALVDVPRNVGGRAIRHVPMALLDAQRPTWHTDTAGATRNYCYDPRTPRVFYVWPPAEADAEVEIKYQVSPAAVAIGENIPIGDEWVNALLDYTLYRAFSKDAEFAGTGARAAAHKQAFEAALAMKTQADAAQVPREQAEA